MKYEGEKLVTERRLVGRLADLESENNAHYSLPTGSQIRLSVAIKSL